MVLKGVNQNDIKKEIEIEICQIQLQSKHLDSSNHVIEDLCVIEICCNNAIRMTLENKSIKALRRG